MHLSCWEDCIHAFRELTFYRLFRELKNLWCHVAKFSCFFYRFGFPLGELSSHSTLLFSTGWVGARVATFILALLKINTALYDLNVYLQFATALLFSGDCIASNASHYWIGGNVLHSIWKHRLQHEERNCMKTGPISWNCFLHHPLRTSEQRHVCIFSPFYQ